MTKSPAYQWYPKDILASQRVAMMSLKEEGAYRRALDFCWINGSLPADSEKLARVIGKGCTKKIADVVKEMFSPHEKDATLLIHDRQEQERAKQAEWLRKSSEAGKKSAQARAGRSQPTANQTSNVGSTNLETKIEGWLPNGTNQNPTLQSSSSSSKSSNDDERDRSSSTLLRPLQEIADFAIKDEAFQCEAAQRANIPPEKLPDFRVRLPDLMAAFVQHKRSEGHDHDIVINFRKHFKNWLPKRLKDEATGKVASARTTDEYLEQRRKNEEKTRKLSQ